MKRVILGFIGVVCAVVLMTVELFFPGKIIGEIDGIMADVKGE